MFNKEFFNNGTMGKQFFTAQGSFGQLWGDAVKTQNSVFVENDTYKMMCEFEEDEFGIITRHDSFTNKSNNTISVTDLKSRFVFEGGEYLVYTQYNGWMSESKGEWQPLVSNVSIGSQSIRGNKNSAPFMVLWSEQQQRGVAFHILPDCAWEMSVTKIGIGGPYTKILVEMGIEDRNLNLNLNSGETFNMPEILAYEVSNKIDMDCHKLHSYMHKNSPRNEMPVIFNTWMCRFDKITYENVSALIPLAAEMGAEYFCIDAGWFGNGALWDKSVGDWSENMTSGLCGRMGDISKMAREYNMGFGLWLEPERANIHSNAVKEHGEYYIKSEHAPDDLFLDFSNKEAVDWVLNVIFDLVDKYHITNIKNDFNADLYFDREQTAFRKYFEGHSYFVKTLREKYPDMYLTSCGSGGQVINLATYKEYDSSWPSDNESPHYEMEIFKNKVLRMPPQGIERWVAIHSLVGFEDYYKHFGDYNKEKCERIIASGDASWTHLEGVDFSYLKAYMTGAPIGIGSDISLWSDDLKCKFKEFVNKFKEERDFWRTAVVRILCDTKTVTAYQYSDIDLKKNVIQVLTGETMQTKFTVYPKVDVTKNYKTEDGKMILGSEIQKNGITLTIDCGSNNWHCMEEIVLYEGE